MDWKRFLFITVATVVAIKVFDPLAEAVVKKIAGGRSIENILSAGKAA